MLALIGSCYSMSGRWQEGETNLLKARKLDPADADVNGLLGQFYLSQGKALKGAFYLEHALKGAPELVELRANLVDIYLDAGQPARARLHLEVLLRERGGEDFGEARLEHAYARVLVLAGSFREALPFAMRAQQAQPSQPAFSRTLGLCLLGMGRYGEAARMLSAGRNVGTSQSDAELRPAARRSPVPGPPLGSGRGCVAGRHHAVPRGISRSTRGSSTITSVPPVPARRCA